MPPRIVLLLNPRHRVQLREQRRRRVQMILPFRAIVARRIRSAHIVRRGARVLWLEAVDALGLDVETERGAFRRPESEPVRVRGLGDGGLRADMDELPSDVRPV